MSRLITNTNIMVDDFDFCKSFPKGTFQHFLSHFHSDHYQGLSALWDYGSIHCTHQTKAFLLDKYPKLPSVHSYDYYKAYTLPLVPQKLDIKFTLFDAKHIPGAAMILFQGHMGSILYTGDFRYEYSMVQENEQFFPPRLRQFQQKQERVEQMPAISIKVDEMIFDNTYCNSAFAFETEPAIAQKMIAIIERNRDKQLVYIAMGALGKHRILMKIAEHFQTSIVVTPKQLRKITVANLKTDFLTTDPSQGYIQLISKKNRAEVVGQTKRGPLGQNFICIDTDFLMLEHQSPDQINYIVPYSLHSNFKEMQTLVRMVQPCILRKIVVPYANFRQVKLRIKIDHRLKFARYLDYLQREVQHSLSGYAQLIRNHTAIYELSQQYLHWFHPAEQQKLMALFQLGSGQQDHNLRKRKPVLLTEEEMTNRSSLSKNRRKLKDIADQLNAVNKNSTLETAFNRHKEQLNEKKFKAVFGSEETQTFWKFQSQMLPQRKQVFQELRQRREPRQSQSASHKAQQKCKWLQQLVESSTELK